MTLMAREIGDSKLAVVRLLAVPCIRYVQNLIQLPKNSQIGLFPRGRGEIMSKIMRYIIKTQEQTGENLIKQQWEAEMYGTLTPEQIQAELENDSGFQEFLDSLDSENRAF
jgi:hypothetical protein